MCVDGYYQVYNYNAAHIIGQIQTCLRGSYMIQSLDFEQYSDLLLHLKEWTSVHHVASDGLNNTIATQYWMSNATTLKEMFKLCQSSLNLMQ